MIVLGAAVHSGWAKKLVTMCVEQAKADKWASQLKLMIDESKCVAEQAGKMAGKLNFAVTVQANRVGGAFIKPFYARQYAPLRHGRMSQSLQWAAL